MISAIEIAEDKQALQNGKSMLRSVKGHSSHLFVNVFFCFSIPILK